MEIFPEFQEQAHHPVEIVDRGAHEHEAREQDHRGRSPDQRVKRLHPLRDAFEVHVFAAARPREKPRLTRLTSSMASTGTITTATR